MEWSDKGVIKVTGIILKRFANAGVWEDYRQKRMNITGNVIISVDEQDITSLKDLRTVQYGSTKDQELSVEIIRDGNLETVQVKAS